MIVRSKKKLSVLLLSVLATIAIFIFFYNDPATQSFFPTCPFLAISGYQCPGCGSQRAIHQMLHFNYQAAFVYNPLVVIFTPYILLGLYIEYLDKKRRFLKIRNILYGRYAALIILLLIVAYWIIRNIL